MTPAAGASADLLATIVAATTRSVEVRREQVPFSTLEARASERPPRGAAFVQALRRHDRVNIIAECKRRSPSRGVLRREYNAAEIAATYARNGAAAISVLTEPTFFDGRLDDLAAVRARVDVPVLRKDFIVDEYQLLEARAWGADAVLLIVAALTPASLRWMVQRAADLGLAALVEVHDRAELAVALDCGGEILGVNNRNLRTLEVSVNASLQLIDDIPRACVAVAESGLRTRDDLARLRALGYDAFLVGERLMTNPDPGAALRDLL